MYIIAGLIGAGNFDLHPPRGWQICLEYLTMPAKVFEHQKNALGSNSVDTSVLNYMYTMQIVDQ